MVEQLLTDITRLRRSPLAHLRDQMSEASTAGAGRVNLREIPFLTMVGIRVNPRSSAAAAMAAVTGVPLPGRHGQVTGEPDGTAVLWLGPDEFLLVGQPDAGDSPGGLGLATDRIVPELVEALGDHRGSVVDLSGNRTTLELNGPFARAVLEKGCHVDLHPRAFTPGSAVATTLGPVPVTLWQTGESIYRVMPRVSFAGYMARWLLDAMREYTTQEDPGWP